MAEELNFTYTSDEFKRRVMQYHKQMEETRNVFPDLAGLLNFLDIGDEEYEFMKDDDRYKKTIRWARRRRESFLNREAIVSKNTTGIKMLLAQPENGGYTEKPVDKTPRKLEVVLRGANGEEEE